MSTDETLKKDLSIAFSGNRLLSLCITYTQDYTADGNLFI